MTSASQPMGLGNSDDRDSGKEARRGWGIGEAEIYLSMQFLVLLGGSIDIAP